MPELKDFDLEAFQAKVRERIKSIQKLGGEIEPFYAEFPYPNISKLKAENPGCLGWIPVGLIVFQAFMSRGTARSLKKNREELTKKAEEVAKQREVKLRVCPSLKDVGDDPLDVAKLITPILMPLAKAKIISMPLDANVFAMLAIVIVSMGVADFCADKDKAPVGADNIT